MNPVFLDGKYGTTDDMTVSVLDRGYLFGDGVYEVYRVYGKTPFTRDLHLARLDRSLAGLELTMPYSRQEFCGILDRMEELSPPDSYIYIHVTRGVAPRRHAFPEAPRPSVMVMAVPLAPFQPAMFQQGISLSSQVDDRWLRCEVKSLNLLANCMAITRANRQGSFETLLVGADGLVNESGSSSFFAVVDGILRTAPLSRNILPGVTRHVLIELAREHDVPCREQAMSLAQALAAGEAFITNSVFEILPVAAIDGRRIGSGPVPGPVTTRMVELFARKVAAETRSRAVCLAAIGR
jgi:D-alanine transaminase